MVLTRAADGQLEFSLSDDGVGFDVARARGAGGAGGGLGLKSLDERVRLIDGTIEIESAPRQGTQVCVRVPLPEDGVFEEEEAEP
jgi:signal transduction histidine kinase